MLQFSATATLTVLTALIVGAVPSYAQTNSSESNTTQIQVDNTSRLGLARAQNLARMAAEKANGGLGNYRAESSMYGSPLKAPYKENADGSWTFTFTGHKPDSTTPFVESVVTVARDASKVNVDYNGAIRSAGQ
ncbi:MAG TPA: hypothetical protein V6C85_09745 [Allocoleopsis sp.]